MKKIILVGKAASGKDYFKNFLLEKGYKGSISHTTRPMRDGEVDGVDYHFVSKESFLSSVNAEHFFEFKKFNDWFYGTSITESISKDVFIFTPEGVKSLPYKFKIDCVIVYLNMDLETRLERLKQRSDSDKIQRRLDADEVDFKDFKDFNISVSGEVFDCEYVLKKILSYEV